MIQQKCVNDIGEGIPVDESRTSYSFALPLEAQKSYDLHLDHKSPNAIIANLIHKDTGDTVGQLRLGIFNRTHGNLEDFYLKSAHLGMNLAPIMQDVVLAHAFKNAGVKFINQDNQDILIKNDQGSFNTAEKAKKIEPFSEFDKAGVALVKNAINKDKLRSVKLDGKHSGGSSLFLDEVNNIVWLLKPGSGGQSRAQGIGEDTASQSRREVAFNKVADIVGLGKFVPASYLVLMDGNEVAMLQFFGAEYKNLNTVRKERPLDTVFAPHIPSGIVHRLAFLDYLLGQVDRHAGNVMANQFNEIKLIDAGSTFAGRSFSPARDPRSFIPIYLRAMSSKDFMNLTPEERCEKMPIPTEYGEQSLRNWVESLPEGQIVNLLNKYGINPQFVIDRLKVAKNYPGKLSEFLNKFWSGCI